MYGCKTNKIIASKEKRAQIGVHFGFQRDTYDNRICLAPIVPVWGHLFLFCRLEESSVKYNDCGTALGHLLLSQPNPTPTQQQLNLTRLRLDSIITPNLPHPPPQTSHWSRARTAQDRGFSLVESYPSQ